MIIIEPCAGLGNRLLALTSAYEMGKQLGREVKVVWKREAGCNIRSGDLFTFSGVEVVDISENGIRREPFSTLMGNRVKEKLRGTAGRFVECDEIEGWKKTEGFGKIASVIEEEPVIYIKSYTNLCEINADSFRFLTPAQEVWRRGKTVFDRIGKDTVGVHIRRTDHTDAVSNSPLSLFIDKMREEAAERETVFYVTTDDAEVLDELRSKFPDGNLIVYEGKVLDRDSKTGIQDALVDMLCLSKCRKIIGSYLSTFSLIPSIMGNAELETVLKKK